MDLLSLLPEKPNVVIFDLDGTLRYSLPAGDELLVGQASVLGVECTDACRRKARQWAHRYWADSECLMLDEETYGRGETAFWVNYARRTLTEIGAAPAHIEEWAVLLNEHMVEHYHPEDIIPPGAIPTLQALRNAGITIGLLTNRTNPVDEYLVEVGLAEHLDFSLSAGQVGVWKPNPEIFYYALGMAMAVPSRTVFVGDNYYADVLGSRRAGIQPVLIDREDIFPDADCPVIKELNQLLPLLGLNGQ